ncbi:hypothetical protein SISSUDRAFT_1116571 [Sistotremastrum suecicum HHB10207 ss-3]|uniref:BAG domain-containing protein n=1 Tax=Sistotremastrum suecicum HHB10207 ss-3 TaxID=1314776 RepID=A0A166HYB8_9AGAM|nr:hypothetical protein SISSUDRAFT_1116571 [Sistotremastrum suecicum HHB10207 ss-3]
MLLYTPQQFNYQPSPRDRYLRALAEENAAREAYAAQLARERYNPYSIYNSYDDDDSDVYMSPAYSSRSPYLVDPYQRSARSRYLDEQREYLRLKEIEEARQAALEEKRRERERIAEARRRQYEHYLQQQRQAQEARERRSQSPFQSIFDFVPSRPIPATQPVQKVSDRAPSTSTSSDSLSQKSRPEPSLEAKEEAAIKIQSFVRTTFARRRALSSLASIRSQFESLCSSFTFPTTLEFEPDSVSPKLTYSSTNAPVHAQEDSLMRLLSKLDAVESAGDKKIRAARKQLANEIEAALSVIDSKKEEMWTRQKTSSQTTVAELPSEDSSMQVEEAVPTESPSDGSEVTVMEVDTTIPGSPTTIVPEAESSPQHLTNDTSSTSPDAASSPEHLPLQIEGSSLPSPIVEDADDAALVESELFPSIDESAWSLDEEEPSTAATPSIYYDAVDETLGESESEVASQIKSQCHPDSEIENGFEML